MTTRDTLDHHLAAGKAMGCFSVYSLETLQAVVNAAQLAQAPVMLSIGNEAIAHAGLQPLGRAALAAAEAATVPVFVHRNHGKSLEQVARALDLGLPSVMFDGSNLPFAENLQLTCQAVELGARHGAIVEGELGVLGEIEGTAMNDSAAYIDQALRFVAQTGVDILAVSIPKGDDCDMGLLQQLCRELPCPLAIHAASRLGPQGAAMVATAGAAKVNFHSEIKQSMALALQENTHDPLLCLANMRRQVAQTVAEKLVLLQGASPSGTFRG